MPSHSMMSKEERLKYLYARLESYSGRNFLYETLPTEIAKKIVTLIGRYAKGADADHYFRLVVENALCVRDEVGLNTDNLRKFLQSIDFLQESEKGSHQEAALFLPYLLAATIYLSIFLLEEGKQRFNQITLKRRFSSLYKNPKKNAAVMRALKDIVNLIPPGYRPNKVHVPDSKHEFDLISLRLRQRTISKLKKECSRYVEHLREQIKKQLDKLPAEEKKKYLYQDGKHQGAIDYGKISSLPISNDLRRKYTKVLKLTEIICRRDPGQSLQTKIANFDKAFNNAKNLISHRSHGWLLFVKQIAYILSSFICGIGLIHSYINKGSCCFWRSTGGAAQRKMNSILQKHQKHQAKLGKTTLR